jgi:hypothetical protein
MGEELEIPVDLKSDLTRTKEQLDQSALYLLWLDSKRTEFRSKLRRINNRIRRTLDRYGSSRACRG